MEILYVGMKFDYGDPARGRSFEHWNFYSTLARMGHNIHYFDFMSLHSQIGHKKMNKKLLEIVRSDKPDLMFCFLHEDELDRNVIRTISNETETNTLNWFADDHWRFERYSKYWAPSFNWVVTTDESAPKKYRKIGCKNVIKSQWGYNQFLYKNLGLPLKYDVTFIGQPHGDRREVIMALVDEGIDVQVWGHGWEAGRLDQSDMIKVFNQSKINLNLSNASRAQLSPGMPPEISKLKKIVLGQMKKSKLGVNFVNLVRVHLFNQRKTIVYPDQVKARNFEIPGCGGFQISSPASGLGEYFLIGEEIITADGINDLIQKIKYYLRNDDERIRVSKAGHRRAARSHTYSHRFNEIFRTIGV